MRGKKGKKSNPPNTWLELINFELEILVGSFVGYKVQNCTRGRQR